MMSKYAVWGIEKPTYMKKQEEKEFLSSSAIKTPLNKIPLLNVLF